MTQQLDFDYAAGWRAYLDDRSEFYLNWRSWFKQSNSWRKGWSDASKAHAASVMEKAKEHNYYVKEGR